MVVHGEPGMDEISPLGPTSVVEVRHGTLSHWTIDADIAGVAGVRGEHLVGGDPSENATLIESVLAGGGPPGAQAAVILNGAAAYYVSTMGTTFGDAVTAAKSALAQGVGMDALSRLRIVSRRAAGLA